MSKLIVRIEHDSDIECPTTNGDGQWILYSFCSRHKNFKHPDEFDVVVGRNHVEKVLNRKLAAQLKQGYAFWLGYFEHGNCAWFRSDSPPAGVEFQWDGVRYAGLLVMQDINDMVDKSYEDRAKHADSFLDKYNSWANGEGLYYSIETEDGEYVDSCGGFYGCDADYMLDQMVPHLLGHEFKVEGDAGNLEDKLRAKVAVKEKESATV